MIHSSPWNISNHSPKFSKRSWSSPQFFIFYFYFLVLNLLSKITALANPIPRVPLAKSPKNLFLSVRLSKGNNFSSLSVVSLQSDNVVDSFSLKQKPCMLILPISMVMPKKSWYLHNKNPCSSIFKDNSYCSPPREIWSSSAKLSIEILIFHLQSYPPKNFDFYLQRLLTKSFDFSFPKVFPLKVLIFHLQSFPPKDVLSHLKFSNIPNSPRTPIMWFLEKEISVPSSEIFSSNHFFNQDLVLFMTWKSICQPNSLTMKREEVKQMMYSLYSTSFRFLHNPPEFSIKISYRARYLHVDCFSKCEFD